MILFPAFLPFNEHECPQCVCARARVLYFLLHCNFFHYHGIVGNDFSNVQVEAYYRDFQEQCLL